MADIVEEYRRRVRKRLSRAENEPVARMVDALCLPSFHVETLLRLVENSFGTTFRLFSLTENLWFCENANKVTRFQESVLVSQR